MCSIPTDKRLAVTLRYLVTGSSFVSLSGDFIMGVSTVSEIVKETCVAIIKCLKEYSKPPTTADDWKAIADEFWKEWNYPNCIGALDWKHCRIKPPANFGSHYINYKKEHRIVLMALVGPDYRFIHADVGMNGRVSDGGVWSRISLKKKLFGNEIILPAPAPFNYPIVGDAAFPLSTKLMKPYSTNLMENNKERRIFNYRLSRARNKSENCFGILVHRFDLLSKPIRTRPESAIKSIMAAMSLHNWLMTKKGPGQRYSHIDDCPEVPTGTGIISKQQQAGNRSSIEAQKMRDELCAFLVVLGLWTVKMTTSDSISINFY